ncbi:MAG: hypothetical protein IJ727_04775 [Treponema sp.]|nr:hypothetical protein [Treponema sp.]
MSKLNFDWIFRYINQCEDKELLPESFIKADTAGSSRIRNMLKEELKK